MKKIKRNSLLIIGACLFVVSIVVMYSINLNTSKKSEIKYSELQRKSDSVQKVLTDSLQDKIDLINILKNENRKADTTIVQLEKQNKLLKRKIIINVKTNTNAQYRGVRELSSSVARLENKQREREQRQRERQRDKNKNGN